MQPSERFIHERKKAWQRLEDLLRRLDRSSLRRLGREEVRELGRIYRRTASDLAIARAESRDPRLVNYLNSLVIRAHGRIYRANAQGGRRLLEFFTKGFPQTFRRTWRYTAVAFLAFAAASVAAYILTWRDPDFSELAGVQPLFRLVINAKVRWWERVNDANQFWSSFIMTNNIWVMFRAFATGAFFGIGTLYEMIFNGASIASTLALVYRAGYGNELVAFMVGHGVIELSCIFLAGGAGLLIGSALLMPGDMSRADALKMRGMDAIRLIAGCVPLLVVAGTIEGFISPMPIDPAIKVSIGVATGVALYSYLLLAGRGKEEPEATAGS
ncbi:MAG TPA: stage II sporulation protein M [Pyrinomonadaceae bacterium]